MSRFSGKTNRQTWEQVLAGDVTAYQTVVESHQSAVSAVAYAICGDFPTSQDIAQETFWVAWTKRNNLRDFTRLGSWLCGIARNLAKQYRRRQKRILRATGIDAQPEPSSDQPDPMAQSIAAEEQQVVWHALESIPESLREVLTLYYRQGQSINQVADSLGINVDAARQRLSRGRTMLRGRVAGLIEGVLDRSKPDRTFAAKVIAGLAGGGMAGQASYAYAGTASVTKLVGTAASASTATAKGILASTASVGLLGGFLGAIGGLAGGLLGTWLPAQLAATETERQLILYHGRVIMGMAIVFTLAILATTVSFVLIGFPVLYFVIAVATATVAFTIPTVIKSIRLQCLVKNLQQNLDPSDDPNQSRMAALVRKNAGQKIWRGKRYTSQWTIAGHPVLDIQFSDVSPQSNQHATQDGWSRRHARGWIAIGDKATGILFAFGGIAKGFIAIGGFAIGGISFGGMAVGIVSCGGAALGLMLGIGGLAIGNDSAGGGAIGWHSAAGGGAVAWHAAVGGAAIAREYAVGGAAVAAQANTALAKQVIQEDSLFNVIMLLSTNQWLMYLIIVPISILPAFATRFCYTQEVDAGHLPDSG